MSVRSVVTLEAMRTYQDSFVPSLYLKPFSFLQTKRETKGYIDKLNHLNLFFMCPWYCKIKTLHPCQALKCQIWGSLKAAVCLIRSPYRAAQSCSSLSAQDLFFNKGDQDGSLCNTRCCVSCSATGRDDLHALCSVNVCVNNLEETAPS